MKSESEIQQLVQIEGPFHACILMRNNSGSFEDKDGRQVRFGLGNISKRQSENLKSSDLIGITSVIITPGMVGQRVAVFTAIEIKAEGWKPTLSNKREKAQLNFINWVKSLGGIASIVSSVDEFKSLFRK